MQFRVPQFIDIEDKILGPLTWKQAAYCLGALGSFYISLRLTDSKILGLIFAAIPTALFLSLAFVKINNRNFVDALENAFKFYTKSRLYTWQKRDETAIIHSENMINKEKSKLSEISTLLNVRTSKDGEENN
jgi:hypothetical protein